MVDDKRLLGPVNLATKARKAVNGEFSTEESVESGKSHSAIVPEEALDNTRKKFINMYTYYEVPIYPSGIEDGLGYVIGQEFRASLSMEGTSFARSIIERMNASGGSLNESK